MICLTRQTAERFNVSHSVIVLLKQRVNQTGSVKECQRTERYLKMTPREDRLLKRLTRQQPFSTTNALRSQWIVNGRINRRTVNRRLNSAWFRARRPITRPLLTIRHKLSGFNGHVTIWDGISGHGRECTGRMKVVFVESS